MGSTVLVRLGNEVHRVAIGADGQAHVDDLPLPLSVVQNGGSAYRVREGTALRTVFVSGSGDRRQVFVDGEVYDLRVGDADGRPPRARPAVDQLSSPMPAKVTRVLVEVGQAVRRGEVVLKLEAMKMELPIRAPRDGTVRAVACREGELVQPGVGLVDLS